MESSKPTSSNICTGVSRIVFHLTLTMSHIAWWSVRSMSMIIKNLASRHIWIILTITARVHSGVPQRSVLGPLLFTMYYRPLSATIDSHYIIHNSFDDDLQSQMSAPSDEIFELHYYMQSWMSDVKCWATANMLSPNDNKTEFMLVTSNLFKHPITYLLQSLSAMLTFPSNTVKNLGFAFDCHLTMNERVSILLGHATFNCVAWHQFVDSRQVLQLPHLYLLLLCLELTTVAHGCLVLLMMWHPTFNGSWTMQLE